MQRRVRFLIGAARRLAAAFKACDERLQVRARRFGPRVGTRDEQVERGDRALKVRRRELAPAFEQIDHARGREYFKRSLLRFGTRRQERNAEPVDQRRDQLQPVRKTGRTVLAQSRERVVAGHAQILARVPDQLLA
jgi:hypothetical protein